MFRARYGQWIFRIFLICLIAMPVLFLILIGIARALTPILDEYRVPIATFITEKTQLSTHIENLEGSWHWFQPMVKIHGIILAQPNVPDQRLTIQEVDVSFNLFSSLWHWSPEIGTVSVYGSSASFIQTPSGGWIFQNLGASSSATINTNQLLQWILTRDRIRFSHVNLTFIPQGNVPVKLNDINLDLLTFTQEHLLDIEANVVKKNHHSSVELFSHFKKLKNQGNAVEAHTHLMIKNITLSDWLPSVLPYDLSLSGHLSQMNIIATTQGKTVQTLSCHLSGEALSLSRTAKPEQPLPPVLHTDQLIMGFQLTHSGVDWHAQMGSWQSVVNGRTSKNQATVSVHYPSEQGFQIEAELADVDLATAQMLLAFMPQATAQAWAEKLLPLHLSGHLTNITAHVSQTPNLGRDYALDASLDNLSWASWHTLPAFTGVNGKIHITPKGGQAALSGDDINTDFPVIFRAPVQHLTWDTVVNWVQQDGGWLLQSQATHASLPAGDINGKLSLFLPADDRSSVIDLDADVNIHQLTKQNIHDFLPVNIMPQIVVTWLDTNLSGIGQTSAHLILKGPLRYFPFDAGNGQFQISAPFNDASLFVSAGWPHANGVSGNMLFSGRTMAIQVSKGDLSGAHIHNTEVNIPQMGSKTGTVLQIKGQAEGDASALFNFLIHSPLKTNLSLPLQETVANGPVQLGLNLSIPLDALTSLIWSGQLDLGGVSVKVPAWQFGLDGLVGQWDIDQGQWKTTGLKAQFMGWPLLLSTVDTPGLQGIIPHLQFSTVFDIQALTQRYPFAFDTLISGKTPIQGDFKVTEDKAIRLSLSSNLEGVTVHLPLIFQKTAASTLPVTADLAWPDKGLPTVRFQYGTVAAGIFLLNTLPQLAIKAGHMVLGNSTPPVLPNAGVTVTVDLPVCSTAVWQSTEEKIKPFLASLAAQKTSMHLDTWPAFLNEVQLSCGVLTLGGTTFHQMIVGIQPKGAMTVLSIQSPDAVGEINWPHAGNHQPLTVHMQHLNWPASHTASTPTELDPAALPPVTAEISDFKYLGHTLGDISVNSSSIPQGAKINIAIAAGKPLQGKIALTWLNRPVKTEMTGQLQSQDLLTLLNAWAHSAHISSEDSTLQFNVGWPAAPMNFAFARLNGQVTLTINNGTILGLDKSTDAKIGLGRLLTLLSLQSLPDRLRTGYAKNGFNFTRFLATLTLANGQATITQAVLTSPIAGATITGQIDLVAQAYHMTVTIFPHLTSSVPVAATLVGGPIVGVVAWAADKVLSPAVNTITQDRYSVTGSWSNPVITKLNSP